VQSVKERSRIYEFFLGAKGTVVDGDGKVIKKFKFNNTHDAEAKNWFGTDAKFDQLVMWKTDQTKVMLNDPLKQVKINEQEDGKLKADYHAGRNELDYATSFSNRSLYVIDNAAYNQYDAGNYMAGASFRILGWPTICILGAAQLNSVLNANKDNIANPDYKPRPIGIQFDQSSDQRALRRGAKFGRKHKNEF
jgi:hypothetical protein